MGRLRYSVIIPALNEEKFLPKLLDSLVGQSERNFEVIVVDGKSHDKTVAVAKSFEKKLPHLSVLISEKASLPFQRNLGGYEAKGEWFVFIDADSIVLPHFFERIGAYIGEKNPKLFTTWFRPDSEDNSDAVFTLIGNIFIEASIRFKRPLAPGPLSIMTRGVFDHVGGYNELLKFGEDYDFSKRAIEHGFAVEILRETLYAISLRRVRNEGKLKFMNTYLKASLLVLLTKRNFTEMPGYVMGGHVYGKKKK